MLMQSQMERGGEGMMVEISENERKILMGCLPAVLQMVMTEYESEEDEVSLKPMTDLIKK
jgi:hypothetical protein